MTTIHMETEKVRTVASKLDADGSFILNTLGQTRSAASRLHYAWQGGNAEEFNSDLNRLLKKIENHAVLLQNLSTRVSREADEWLAADHFENGSSSKNMLRSNDTIPGNNSSSWTSQFKKGQQFVIGIGLAVMDGIHTMYGVAKDQFNRQIAQGQDAVQRAVQSSDDFLDDGFTNLLGNPQNGSSESITLQVKGDVSIPGVEVGVPGSFKVEGAKEVTIIKEDGKYKLILSNGGGLGVEEPLIPGGEGKIKFGKNTYGVTLDASAEAMAKGKTEVTYEFDPQKAGDMTKMAAFMYGIGVMNSTAGPLVAPALYTLKDNITGIKVGIGAEGSVKADASVLVKLAGENAELQGMAGRELRRVDGKWESIQQTEIKLDSHASILTNKFGGEMNARYETITHPDGSQSVKVIVDVRSDAGRELKLTDLKELVPPLDKLKGSNEKFEAVQMEFTVDAPLETAKKMIESPEHGINWKALNENSKLVIHEKTGTEMGFGGSGKVQLPTQKIGIGGEANVIRESSREIYSSR